MIKWIKNHFIPHHGNDHRPHFLRKRTTVQAVLLVVVLELILVILPGVIGFNPGLKGTPAQVLTAVLTHLTNEERGEAFIPTLKESELLNEAATLKAQDMAAKGYFAHTSPEGLAPWYWFDKVGYKYDYAGENLAVDFVDSEDVTKAWMNSPTHRANIVKQAYTEVGTGIAHGVYQGHDTIFVVQMYARPVTPLSPVVPQNIVPSAQVGRSSSPSVQGAQVAGETKPVSEDTPVAKPAAPTNPNVVTKTADKLTATPRHTVNVLLLTLLAVVFIALVLDVVIKPKIQHKDLITNGLALATLLLAVYVFNSYIVTRSVTVPNEAAAIVAVQ